METLDYIKNKFDIRKNGVHQLSITREQMYELFNELGYKTGIEIGVFKGLNAARMLKVIPELKLFCVDSWKPVGRRSARAQKIYYQKARYNLRPFRLVLRAKIVKKYSMDAVNDFEDESLDFVYIDANHHFDYVMEDIIEWSKKVKIGGIVSGHDYYNSHREGVMKAVNVYVFAHLIKNLFITKASDRSKKAKSWFWVKEK